MTLPVFTDTHCHLDFNKFDPDRDEVLRRAEEAGVTRILIPGTSLTSSRSAVELAECHPGLYAAIGIHPTEIGTLQVDTLAGLHKLASESPKIVAVGEIGLDYYWDTSPHDVQQHLLTAQLNLAAELCLPVVIHFREKGDAPDGDCARDLLKLLGEWVAGLRSGKSPLADRPGVLHSFSGSLETARAAIRFGFFLGVTGPVTYRKDRQELVRQLPLENLLIETDAPFLAPHPQRGKRNEPAYVRLIADKIALLHSCSIEEVAAATSQNARRLLDWKET